MSDFDAEAERERLREKYEADEENRKRTQQMSELLLKGATMTNRHCGECGSPIFRYEGQEFCPNCQRTMDGDVDDDSAEPSAERIDPDATAAGGAAPSDREASAADAEPATPGSGEAGKTRRANDPAANGVSAADSATGAGRDRDAGSGAASGSPAGGRPDATVEPTAGDDQAAPTRRAARDSLLAALTRHARLAADADEPRRATDHLEAARTAAAALDELDGS